MDYKRLSECAYYRNERTKQIDYETYISTENMLPNKAGITLAESLPEVKSTSKYLPNDILISNIRPYFKKIWLSDRVGGCSNDVLVVTAKDNIIPKFLYYVLSDNNFFNYDTVTSKGTKMPRGTPKAIMQYLVPDVENEYQKKVVSILFAYDGLIDTNNKRIKALEQMAENLYKEWFVRFRFPGHETAEFENGIPKGWQREKISVYYNTTSGGTPSREYLEFYQDGNIPWVKTGEIKDSIIIDTEEYITEKAVIKSSAKRLPKHCVVMAMYGVNIGMLSYLSKEMTCNQACCVFLEKREFSSKHYLFQYLKSVREYLLLISFGAAQQNLSQDLIKRTRIIMPKDELVKLFEEIVEPLYRQIINLLKQTQNLIKQRDLLLPRLMSGKLEV